MTPVELWWLLALLAWVPTGYGLTLVLKDWLHARRAQRLARPLQPCSVTEIAARIEREAAEAQAEREIRWPHADPDHGVVRDDRSTVPMPAMIRLGRPHEDALTEPCLPALPAPRRVRMYLGSS